MSDLRSSNSLPELAARIRAEHESACAAMKRGTEHAMAAGDLLIEAKAQLRHGQWLPWLAQYCAMSDRIARLYMRLARERSRIETEIGNVADLTVRGAILLLAGTSEPELGDDPGGWFHPTAKAILDDLKQDAAALGARLAEYNQEIEQTNSLRDDAVAEGRRIADRLRRHSYEFMEIGIPAQIGAMRELIVMIDSLSPEEKKKFLEEQSPAEKRWIERQRPLLDPVQFDIRVKATQLAWLQEGAAEE